MDDGSAEQVRALWPDIVDPFSRVIPDGCDLVRAVDDWTSGQRPNRRRVLDLARRDDAQPALGALVEEAKEDAERRGWVLVDEESTEDEVVLEIEDVVLRIQRAHVFWREVSVPVLRVGFDQPWPPDAGAPVETSEMFQNLVRRLLGLSGAPERLRKELTFDGDSRIIGVVRELVLIDSEPDLETRFAALGFSSVTECEQPHPPSAWTSRVTSGEQDVFARVRILGDRVEVEMTRSSPGWVPL